MASARTIISRMVLLGVIPAEFEDAAVIELHRELTRRARRTAHTLATLASDVQLARYAASALGNRQL